MGIGNNSMGGLVREAKRRPFSGVCYTLGRPTMGRSPRQANELFESEGVKPAGGPIGDDELDTTTAFAKQMGDSFVSDVAF